MPIVIHPGTYSVSSDPHQLPAQCLDLLLQLRKLNAQVLTLLCHGWLRRTPPGSTFPDPRSSRSSDSGAGYLFGYGFLGALQLFYLYHGTKSAMWTLVIYDCQTQAGFLRSQGFEE
jgi:hypothetical protein